MEVSGFLEGWPKGADSVTVSLHLLWRCIRIWSVNAMAPPCRHHSPPLSQIVLGCVSPALTFKLTIGHPLDIIHPSRYGCQSKTKRGSNPMRKPVKKRTMSVRGAPAQIYIFILYPGPKFTQPKFTQNPKLRDDCRTQFKDTRFECGLRLPKALWACEWFECRTRFECILPNQGG